MSNIEGIEDKIPPSPKSPYGGSKRKSETEEKRLHFRHSESESDDSDDSASVSSSHIEVDVCQGNLIQQPKLSPRHTKSNKSRQEWEIVHGLKDGQQCKEQPEKYQGFMMKKRKWPMKGWHKILKDSMGLHDPAYHMFFILDKGIIVYAKSPSDIQKGKYHGVIDIGFAVLCFKKTCRRIDIDAEELVHHLKVKDQKLFDEWLSKLTHHRLYRQHEIAYGTKDQPHLTEIKSPTEEISTLPAIANFPETVRTLSMGKETIKQSSYKAQNMNSFSGPGKVAAWLLDTEGIQQCNKELSQAQSQLYELKNILEQMKNLPLATDAVSWDDFKIPDKKKTRLGSRNTKLKNKGGGPYSPQHFKISQGTGSSNMLSVNQDKLHLSSSNPNLIMYEQEKSRPHSIASEFALISNHEQRIKEIKLREVFLNKAGHVHDILKSLVRMVSTERDRLRQVLEQNVIAQNNSNNINTLKESLAEVVKQNGELRARLNRIHMDSHTPEPLSGIITTPLPSPGEKECPLHATLTQSFSAESCSLSEYYDAAEALVSGSDTTSEPSEEASSELSDEEENEIDYTTRVSVSEEDFSQTFFHTGRRSTLPVPKPDTGDISLWNLLCKHIGKDLTKISMPVTLNEPLSMLQRLCEELEYSELLDKASEFDDPIERMIYVAAFAVSCYASSSHRAGHKPFNPILGETYECIREDKNWRFIGEQVSHHPPISACYCDSRNFLFWQDVRIKTKFWGKSMEIQPIGIVNVFLPKFNDHYQWNKVTTCVHNLLGGQRWVDQYGEMQIRNGDIVAKLTFTKASYWSGKRHEVYGQILSQDGKIVHNLFGKWNEALYCGHPPSARCIWRPGAMTDDYALYYGFSRFAIELNELNLEEAWYLPPTDSRFRSDQRLLEEGKIQEAENEKHRIEQLQRERKKQRDESKTPFQPLWFRKVEVNGRDCFEFNQEYWEKRKDPGFLRMALPKLW